MARVVLINPNTSRGTTARMLAIARACAQGSELTLTATTAPFGVPLITDEAGLEVAGRAVLALAPSIDADGVIVAGFGDPGADALSRQLAMPVIGIGEAGLRAAALHGHHFVVVTTTPDLVDNIGRRVVALGLEAAFTGVRVTPGDPAALTDDPPRLESALAAAIERAIIDDWAAAVVIGGGPLAEAARALAPRFSVPIIEPIPEAVRCMAERLSRPC